MSEAIWCSQSKSSRKVAPSPMDYKMFYPKSPKIAILRFIWRPLVAAGKYAIKNQLSI